MRNKPHAREHQPQHSRRKSISIQRTAYWTIVASIALILSFSAFGQATISTSSYYKLAEEFTISMGMANISFTENASSLQGENVQQPSSGSVANITSQMHYRFRTDDRKAWYGQFTFPLMASQGTYLSGGGGMEYYWGKTPARIILRDATTSFTLSPITRYFALVGVNMAYISYLTPTAQKNDTILEIEGGGGISRRFNKWTLRATASIARGVGVATTTMGMKAMIGGTFFLD